MIFLEKCSLLVDRLGHTSECYIEVQQKGGTRPPGPPGYAPVLFCICLHGFSNQTIISQKICSRLAKNKMVCIFHSLALIALLKF